MVTPPCVTNYNISIKNSLIYNLPWFQAIFKITVIKNLKGHSWTYLNICPAFDRYVSPEHSALLVRHCRESQQAGTWQLRFPSFIWNKPSTRVTYLSITCRTTQFIHTKHLLTAVKSTVIDYQVIIYSSRRKITIKMHLIIKIHLFKA